MLDAIQSAVCRKCTIFSMSYKILHDITLSVYLFGFATAANLAIIFLHEINSKFNASNF